jgi:hypothetical protein
MDALQLRRTIAIAASLAVVAVGGSYAAGAFAQSGHPAPARPAVSTGDRARQDGLNRHHGSARIHDHGGHLAASQGPGTATLPSSDEPSDEPTDDPTQDPTDDPTGDPPEDPTDDPTEAPTEDPGDDSPGDDQGEDQGTVDSGDTSDDGTGDSGNGAGDTSDGDPGDSGGGDSGASLR